MKKSLLPHFYKGHSCFFITFRLADSLPQHIILDLQKKMNEEIYNLRSTNKTVKQLEIENIKNKYFKKFDHQLNNFPYGLCVLKDEFIAQILYDKILSYHNVYYDLKCLSIMPNHVHLLLSTLGNSEIPQVGKWLQLIKGGSSYLINKALNTSGNLWAKESFDRYIRNELHYRNSFYYTVNNPKVAKLHIKFSSKPYLYRCDL